MHRLRLPGRGHIEDLIYCGPQSLQELTVQGQFVIVERPLRLQTYAHGGEHVTTTARA